MTSTDDIAIDDPQPPAIYLSPPHLAPEDYTAVLAALHSNWVAPAGPHLARFEAAVAAVAGVPHAVALVSGTAALHLALVILGIGPGDSVLVSDLTFVASANVVRYVGATPVFVDCEPSTWNLDPALAEAHLEHCARLGRLPKAVLAVDLYGQVCRFDVLRSACDRYGVPLIEDAAEALGASFLGQPAGSFGDLGVFSFNGNKVITTSGGGMLVSRRADWITRARQLATQAREPAIHYEHSELGYNYRLSNVLAALGCSQMTRLDQMVARRRAIRERYRSQLASIPGVAFMQADPDGDPSWWLTCLTIDSKLHPNGRAQLLSALTASSIEARPVWKPMHLQRLYTDAQVLGGSVSDRLFAEGICLPSGSALTDDQLDHIIDVCSSCLA